MPTAIIRWRIRQRRKKEVLYDCKTLKYTGIYYDMSSEYLTDGIPWCAIDRENGYLYTSQFHNVGEIL